MSLKGTKEEEDNRYSLMPAFFFSPFPARRVSAPTTFGPRAPTTNGNGGGKSESDSPFLPTAATTEGSIVVVFVPCSVVRSAAGQHAEPTHLPHVRGSAERHQRAAVAGSHQRLPAKT